MVVTPWLHDATFESIRASIYIVLKFWQLVSIRDDLFDTFHKRNRERHELSDVKISADSLQRLEFELLELRARSLGTSVIISALSSLHAADL